MKASQAVSGEIVLEKLIETLMMIAVEHAGAERGLLILPRGEELRIAAEAKTGRDGVEVELQENGDAVRFTRIAPPLRDPNAGERDSG